MAKGGFNVRRRRLRGSTPAGAEPRPPAGTNDSSAGDIAAPAPLDAAALLEAMPDGAMLIDPSRRVVATNARLRRMLGSADTVDGVPQSFATTARRLALAGEYVLVGLGDLIDGTAADAKTVRVRETALASGVAVRVAATLTADGGTLLTFATVAAGASDAGDFARDILRRLPGAFLRARLLADGTAAIVFASPRSCDIFGVEAGRLTADGRSLFDFVHPADRAAVTAVWRGCLTEPGAIDHQYRIVGAEGDTVWTRAVGTAFRDGAETFCDMRLMDIGTHVKVAADRRHLQRLLDMVVENIPHIVTVRDIADMRYVLINRAAHDILGVDVKALIGKADATILPNGLNSQRRSDNRRIIETKKPARLPDTVVDIPAIGRRIFATTKHPLVDDDGVIRYVLTINEDVTERRQAQDALRRSEQRLRDALESFSDGLALFDDDDRLVLCNRHYRDMWPGMAEKTRPGVTFAEMTRALAQSGGLRKEVVNIDAYVAERVAYHRDPPSTREVALADGRWLQVNDRATGESGIVVTCTDITALKEREDALRRAGREAVRAKEEAELANRSKSDFLANMSHELRTPLNAVIGFSEIIKDALLGDGADKLDHYRAYASDIHTSGHHLLALINDLLDMSKIEAGKLDLAVEDVDVAQTIEASLTLVRERARTSQIELAVDVPANLPRLRADARKVKQILINLLSNAVKFTRPGGSVAVEAFVEPSGEFVLRVIDTGIGIPADDIGKALEPFVQVDEGLARSYEGTGLGLALTKSLIELHGGRIEIASRCDGPQTGTTVAAIFPARRVMASGAAA